MTTTKRKQPVAGRTYSRAVWQTLDTNPPPSAKIDGHTVMVSVNYSCEGPYGPAQRVTARGYTITVWHRANSLVSESATVATKKQVPATIRRLVAKVGKHCVHPRVRELSASEAAAHGVRHFGMCYHVEQCLDCQAVYAYDSSD